VAQTELAVVGAGPAGLAAAVAAAQAGVAVTLLDEYPRPGGQYLKAASRPVAQPPLSATERQGHALLTQLDLAGVEVRLASLVWGAEWLPDGGGFLLALHGPEPQGRLEARAVIVAAGARELVIPFPGWTLPGVMTLGAAHLLAKAHGVSPGRRVLLAGSGPLLFPVLHALGRLGTQVVAVLEASHLRHWPTFAPALRGQWDRLREGFVYVKDMIRQRVPYRPGHAVARALGEEKLEAAVMVRLDRHGAPLPGSEETIPVDALCVGLGFLPNVELTQLLGCAHTFDVTCGGWIPVVNRRLETSLAGLYAAGETTGVDGAAMALVEGRLAGQAAAHRLGHLPEAELERELAAEAGRRRRGRRFGAALNTLFTPPPALDRITTPETILCRCEELTAGEVAMAVRGGTHELDALKTWLRVGHGPCQGRTCGPVLARMIARETGLPRQEVGAFHVRPPLKPVPLGRLAQEVNP
jgi:thioredoxin reductase